MLVVPVQPLPSQVISVQLGGQNCTLAIYQTSYAVFMDVYVSGVLLDGGRICQNLRRVIRDAYVGFVGDLAFSDTAGSSDPYYTGLGSRYVLIYLEASDLPVGVG